VGCKKQDGDVLTAFALLDKLRQFQAVHAGHFHVQHNRGKVRFQHGQEGLFCCLGPD
jgi:hypothetical protein